MDVDRPEKLGCCSLSFSSSWGPASTIDPSSFSDPGPRTKRLKKPLRKTYSYISYLTDCLSVRSRHLYALESRHLGIGLGLDRPPSAPAPAALPSISRSSVDQVNDRRKPYSTSVLPPGGTFGPRVPHRLSSVVSSPIYHFLRRAAGMILCRFRHRSTMTMAIDQPEDFKERRHKI